MSFLPPLPSPGAVSQENAHRPSQSFLPPLPSPGTVSQEKKWKSVIQAPGTISCVAAAMSS